MNKTETAVECFVTETRKIIAYTQGFNKGRDGSAMNPYFRDDQRTLAQVWMTGWMDASGFKRTEGMAVN